MRSSKLLGIIHDFFMNLKLHQKFIVGYIFIVFIPVVFFTSLLFF